LRYRSQKKSVMKTQHGHCPLASSREASAPPGRSAGSQANNGCLGGGSDECNRAIERARESCTARKKKSGPRSAPPRAIVVLLLLLPAARGKQNTWPERANKVILLVIWPLVACLLGGWKIAYKTANFKTGTALSPW
jgi:hypothetical protein